MVRTSRWKAGERKSADNLKDLGYGESKREPVSGRTRGDKPDIANETFSIEQKDRKGARGWKFMEDAMDQAIKSKKTPTQVPIVILHQKGNRYLDSLVVVRMRDLPHLFPPNPEPDESTPPSE